jgi:hypothetical protein
MFRKKSGVSTKQTSKGGTTAPEQPSVTQAPARFDVLAEQMARLRAGSGEADDDGDAGTSA